MKRAQCKSCKAPILWTATSHGGDMPLNPTPTLAGTIVIGPGGLARVDAKAPGRKYVSHFATCPNAKQHRRAR